MGQSAFLWWDASRLQQERWRNPADSRRSDLAAAGARRYLAEISPDQVLIKLDVINAFNSVRRNAVLEAVALHIPELLAFTASAYCAPSLLQFGDEQILSEEGVQQGDPLGPLFFSLALNGPLQDLGRGVRLRLPG